MKKIILASSSPRRRELLEKFNVKHRVVKSDISEKTDSKDTAYQLAMSLAFQKAYDVSKKYEDSIVIAADTIVVLKDEILGKPKDQLHAKEILLTLSGRQHSVITGVSLIFLKENIKIVDYEETLVKFRKLDEETIENYISTQEPFDKAGAYGIQGYGGLLVEKIEGSYDNVIGLPMGMLNQMLKEHFDINIL